MRNKITIATLVLIGITSIVSLLVIANLLRIGLSVLVR
jgi:hypothetical protein